jgi:hypothetical protein
VVILALRRHGGGACGSGLGVEVTTGAGRDVVLVELVDQRNAGGDVEFGDVVVADALEVLHQAAQRVAVGGDENRLAGLEVGDDRVVPVRQLAVDHELQRLGAGHLAVDVGVSHIADLAELALIVEQGRRHVERATPQLELLGAELLEGLRLVLALQGAVVTLVEAP